MSSTCAARGRHRLRRRHAHVEEEVGAVRRPRDAPAEAALDRADVDDRRHAAVGVLRIGLPGRDPLEHGVEHLAHAQDRVLVALALAERGVDEVAVRRDAHPERPEVPEHDLRLGRLAEDAHVGDAAVRDEVARAGRVAAVLARPARRPTAPSRSRRRPPRRARRRAAARPRPAARAPPRRSRRARPSCSRCRARRAARPCTNASGWKPRTPASHGSRPEYDVSMWPLNMRLCPPPAPGHVPSTLARPSSTCCHCTCRPMLGERVAHQLGHRLLVAGEARRADRLRGPARRAGRGRSAPGRHGGSAAARARRRAGSARGGARPRARASRACSPASRYSSIARMQSAGVPAIGLQRSSSESVTCSFAASRPPSLHRLGDRRELLHLDPGQLEQRVGGAADVLELVRQVHAGDLARAVAAAVAVVGVDRGDDRAADVDRSGRVLPAPGRRSRACTRRTPAS